MVHPQGQFPAGVKGTFFGYSGNKNTPYIGVTFETSEGIITAYQWLSDAALEITQKALVNCGWDGNDIEELSARPEMLAGNEVWITIKHETWEGKIQAKVAFINKEEYTGGGDPSDMPSDFASRINTLMGGKSGAAPKATTKQEKKSVDGAYDKDDEIPF